MTKFDLQAYIAAEAKPANNYKPDLWIELQKEVSSALGLPGIKFGHITTFYGLSNSGKTSIMIHAAVRAQHQGVLPIMIITENKMDWDRAKKMGLDLDNCLIREDFNYLEDVYDFISQKIEDVLQNRLPVNVAIFWDSVASTPSKETLEILKDGSIKKKYGPQKNASVIGYYNPIIMKRISQTREEGIKGSIALVMLTQAYIKPPDFPGGIATTVPNGGEKIWFPLSLCVEVKEGGQIQTALGERKINFGTVCKLKVVKNHLTETSTSGEFVITAADIIPNEKGAIDEYKKAHKEEWRQVQE